MLTATTLMPWSISELDDTLGECGLLVEGIPVKVGVPLEVGVHELVVSSFEF